MNHPTEAFGLLGPEELPSTRRLRTLGLGATVRYFNDRAVPGMGGVWFAKQLVLALLGVHLAQRTGRSNVEVANAIEALACWLAIHKREASGDPRVRGARKLVTIQAKNLPYARVRQRGFYVSQPMRMGTVRALPALGLVAAGATRFNAFRCTALGEALIVTYAERYRPSKGTLGTYLEHWIQGEEIKATEMLVKALNPCEPLPDDALDQIRERLNQGHPGEAEEDRERRRNALAMVEARRLNRRDEFDWSQQPHQIRSDAHWLDLEAGRRFFLARNAAMDLLLAIERNMTESARKPIDERLFVEVQAELTLLQSAARDFLATEHQNPDAGIFCTACASGDPGQIIRMLVDRDGVVLQRAGEHIIAGPRFVGQTVKGNTPVEASRTAANEHASADDDDGAPESSVRWPPGLSFRINHLFLMNLDLHGELAKELGREGAPA